MLTCDFCGLEKEAYEISDDQLVSNFARIQAAGPHQDKHICGSCYKNFLPLSIYAACYIDMADGEHEGFIMNHSFAAEEPTYIVVARGLAYDGEPQDYVLLTDLPAHIVRARDGETIPQELQKEWEAALAQAGTH